MKCQHCGLECTSREHLQIHEMKHEGVYISKSYLKPEINTLRVRQAIEYCRPHLDQMWAATIVGTLLGGDFRDCRQLITAFDKRNIEEEWAK